MCCTGLSVCGHQKIGDVSTEYADTTTEHGWNMIQIRLSTHLSTNLSTYHRPHMLGWFTSVETILSWGGLDQPPELQLLQSLTYPDGRCFTLQILIIRVACFQISVSSKGWRVLTSWLGLTTDSPRSTLKQRRSRQVLWASEETSS